MDRSGKPPRDALADTGAHPALGGGAGISPGSRVGRYTVLHELGAGGMGVVFAARDEELGRQVALKLLRQRDARSVAAFKREFRALTDLHHNNLVVLHELVSTSDQWFFTMELVRGKNFVEYVRSTGDLRGALRQLVEGVRALHRAGKLHRDIKPPNILVTDSGRVVLLDFGLVTAVEPTARDSARFVVGTAPYVSPEQAAASDAISTASDWYSVGVLLYEALTGQVPFSGGLLEVLTAKLERDASAPSAIEPAVPPDLDELCLDLLQRDASKRPDGSEILRRLGGIDSQAESGSLPAIAPHDAPFVGRRSELLALDSSYQGASDRAVAVHVLGPSGIGKTALVREFLERARDDRGAIVLTGRCYERESVPYKGFDTVVEALSRHLKLLPAIDAVRVVPQNVGPLARLFPALRWLDGLPGAESRPRRADPGEARRRGFAALRDLLTRVAHRGRLVIAIDDLQWVDADSAELLAELMRPPEPPSILWVLGYRSGGAVPTAPLRAALDAAGHNEAIESHELALLPLADDDALDLAGRLLPAHGSWVSETAEAIARDARGNPYLISELARSAADDGMPDDAPSLDDVIWRRVAMLPEPAQVLLEAIAVAGRPLPDNIAVRAARLRRVEYDAVDTLRNERLIRRASTGGRDAVEPYHDRIRETVVARLEPAVLRDRHRDLALAMEGTHDTDPERLAEHFDAAGDKEPAARYARAAAERAAEALAFDRAARLFRRAIDLGADDTLEIALADALANAGRGADAAHSFLAAARRSPEKEALGLQRRAADQFLRSGHIDEGVAAFEQVLAAYDLRFADSPRAALASALWRRALLRLRGVRYKERPERDIAPADLDRIDTLWSVMIGLTQVDPIRSLDFQTRTLQLALAAGEPSRIARALASEAGYYAVAFRNQGRRSLRLMAKAQAIADRIDRRDALAYIEGTRAVVRFHQSAWRDSEKHARRALDMFEDCTGVAWETTTCREYLLLSLGNLGQTRAMRRLLPSWLQEAHARDDLYAATNLRLHRVHLHVTDDDPSAARRDIKNALAPWSQRSYQVQHWVGFQMNTMLDLYVGNVDGAWRRICEHWDVFERSMLTRFRQLRIHSHSLRGRTAAIVARDAAPRDRKWLLRLARKDANRLQREGCSWSAGLAAHIDAVVASVRTDDEAACAHLSDAAQHFDAASMPGWSAATRRRAGIVRAGGDGAAAVAAAERDLRSLGAKSPERLTDYLCPWQRAD